MDVRRDPAALGLLGADQPGEELTALGGHLLEPLLALEAVQREGDTSRQPFEELAGLLVEGLGAVRVHRQDRDRATSTAQWQTDQGADAVVGGQGAPRRGALVVGDVAHVDRVLLPQGDGGGRVPPRRVGVGRDVDGRDDVVERTSTRDGPDATVGVALPDPGGEEAALLDGDPAGVGVQGRHVDGLDDGLVHPGQGEVGALEPLHPLLGGAVLRDVEHRHHDPQSLGAVQRRRDVLHGELAAVLAGRPEVGAVGEALGVAVAEVLLQLLRQVDADPLGHQRLEGLPDELLPAVAEELEQTRVDVADRVVATEDHHRAGGGLQQLLDQPYALAVRRRPRTGHAETPVSTGLHPRRADRGDNLRQRMHLGMVHRY